MRVTLGLFCPRRYFGDQVGFYLAYLNALCCWLMAPAAVNAYLLWALAGTHTKHTGKVLLLDGTKGVSAPGP